VNITESIIEQATLDWFEELGYFIVNGPDIAPGELFAERASYGDVILEGRVRAALSNINPAIPAEAIEDAYRKLARTIHESPLLAANNHRFHKMLSEGIDVEYRNSEGRIVGDKVWLVDFDEPGNNEWLAVNQFTVVEGNINRRPDVVVFVNGLPLGVIELKNPSDENATTKDAFNQLQTYKKEIPSLFPYNEIFVSSDGIEARAGTLTADWEWFLPWRTISGDDLAPKGLPELEVLIKGIFDRRRFLDLLKHFIVFEVDGSEIIKKIAGYHQFHTVNKAVAVMLEKYEIVASMFHGFDYSRFMTGSPAERLTVIMEAMEHILSQDDGQKDGKSRFMQAVTELSKAFALSVPHEKALEIRDHVGFFQTVRAALAKNTTNGGKGPDILDSAVKQIVSKAVASGEVIDIFASAGLKKPNISILSDEFLEEVRHMPQRNLALEVLKKLLNDEIKARSRRNLVQSKSFAEMLEQTIRKYQNRTIDAAKVILELIELAREMREANKRGEKLNLSDEELAFYDALETNDSAVRVLGDETLKTIARELVNTVRKNVTIDWTVKESVKAKLRSLVKRILRKYGYPPDKQDKATQTVLSQAELLCAEWV